MSKKLVVVTNATGKQGSSVLNALLEHGGYLARGLTRDTTSAASKAFTAKGAEMVQVSVTDKAGLAAAFQGAYAVFGYTILRSADSESVQGKNMVDACLANNVPLFIWSSLPSASDLAGQNAKFALLDHKGEVNTYLNTTGQAAVTLYMGVFSENLFNQRQLVRVSPGKWEIQYPIAPAAMRQPFSYIGKDTGGVAVAIIDHWSDASWREKLTENPIPMCSYKITGTDMAKILSQTTGSTVTYERQEETVPEPLKTMWTMAVKYWNYDDPIPPKILVDLGVKFHTFEDFVREEVAPFMEKSEAEDKA
ncbi:NADP-binding protein [Dacryopinax primogenitus]|uniref:NADP-binding protein n=1 Tax=Dacryopinax primogenitus (strain DJM 731) TaxID=1858805 RepID=M5G6E4_DACPD|nr:NADP-binding protein [Dacryopinax primogenitus]EJU01397.1 NADP-binding protein [Dacryopinax primogenitus]